MTNDFPIILYHNPQCGTSRNVLAMIRGVGYEPRIIEYLRVGWTRGTLLQLLIAMEATARGVMREKGTPAAELGLLDPTRTDEDILAAMIKHPILVNRPIVVTPLGVKLCRPSEIVFTLLDRKLASFTKEDGEIVRFAHD